MAQKWGYDDTYRDPALTNKSITKLYKKPNKKKISRTRLRERSQANHEIIYSKQENLKK